MRIFLDANILFSAAKSDGAVRELIMRLRVAGHRLCADAYVVAEAKRNLETKYPSAAPELESLLRTVDVAAFRPGRLPEAVSAQLPEKDRPVLAAAVRLRCDVLVTGDRTHFGMLYGSIVEGVTIHSPRSLAEALTG